MKIDKKKKQRKNIASKDFENNVIYYLPSRDTHHY